MAYDPIHDDRYKNNKTPEELLEASKRAREQGCASYLMGLLENSSWNPKSVAQQLGIGENVLLERIKELNIRR